MNKIKTLFKRGEKFKVINEYNFNESNIENIKNFSYATEKIDGTNIRLTIRNEEVVRIEARKNPTKQQKKNGIIDAWYRDAKLPDDKWIIDAVSNRTYINITDGEYSAEAYGKNIQGNPLNISINNVFIFDYDKELNTVIYEDCPITFDELKKWLPKQKSKLGNGNIEGIVFWVEGYPIAKIKTKDFKKEVTNE